MDNRQTELWDKLENRGWTGGGFFYVIRGIIHRTTEADWELRYGHTKSKPMVVKV
jgi:hypothetical protein